MPYINFRDAFGETPREFEECVRRSLNRVREPEQVVARQFYGERPVDSRSEGRILKRKIPAIIIAAVLAVAMLCGAAFAAINYGVIHMFSYKDDQGKEIFNEAVAQSATQVDGDYDGESLKLSLVDAVYDGDNGQFALSWTVDKKDEEGEVYLVCDGIEFGGELADARTMISMSDFLLPDNSCECGALGNLPDNDSSECTISFRAYRINGEIAEIRMEDEDQEEYDARLMQAISEGKVPIEGDGMIFNMDLLLEQGMMELADQFTIKCDMSEAALVGNNLTYKGDSEFAFDDYEVRIDRVHVSPMQADFLIQYITDEEPVDHGKGIGYLWNFSFSTPEADVWYGNGGGSWIEPVQLEDGRWMSGYEYECLDLFTQPKEIIVTLVTYDEELNATIHSDEAIELELTSEG